jgi:hypothetical protein
MRNFSLNRLNYQTLIIIKETSMQKFILALSILIAGSHAISIDTEVEF